MTSQALTPTDEKLEEMMAAIEAAARDVEYSPYDEDYITASAAARTALRDHVNGRLEDLADRIDEPFRRASMKEHTEK